MKLNARLFIILMVLLCAGVKVFANERPRVVLVTGSFRGLGLKVAEDLVEKGQIAVLSGRDLSQAPAWALKVPGPAMAVKLDMASEQSMREALAAIVNRYGRLDAIVHNANATTMAPTFSLSPDALAKALQTNFQGPALLTQLAIPFLQQNTFGRIIYLSSSASLLHQPDMAAYNSSKAAAESYFRTMAGDLKASEAHAGSDIDVAVLRLSFVRSDYEPVVQVEGHHSGKRKGFMKLMSWLRNNSPTTDATVSEEILRILHGDDASVISNVGWDGKAVLGISLVPTPIRAACEKLLSGMLHKEDPFKGP